MCGIAGVLYSDPSRPIDGATLARMGHAIAHRGPDAEGFWSEPGVGLVHRRLSIIDLAGGDQPIGNEDGSVQVVFNGEIYNFQSLRAELEAKGHRFKTRSDTEVLVHLYEEKGEDLVSDLRGMFAFAIWDLKKRRLVLARDRLGVKPFYLYRDHEKLLFASEPKAILAFPGIVAALEPAPLEDYLAFGMVPGEHSIFKGIEKLPAAHVVTLTHEDLKRTPRCYWRLRFDPDERPSERDWQERIRAKFAETVRLHTIADVPVGAFLSGGLDSSVVVAAGAQAGPLHTFSMGFAEQSFSELPFARLVAERYGTRHVEEMVTPDAVSLLDELAHYYDEPFGDSSAIPTFLVSKLASRSVKVVLSGDGGDEAFGGYARYAHDLNEAGLRGCLPAWFRRAALGPLARIWPKTDWLPKRLRARTRLTNLSLEPAHAYANTLTQCRLPLRRQLLSPDILASLNGRESEQIMSDAYLRSDSTDALAGMTGADVQVMLPDDFLVKVDRASMANGLEVRPPLLDHELFELAARIPSKFKIHQGETKWIFKRAFADRLPTELMTRPKQGFEVPLDSWLQGPLNEVFRSSVLANQAKVSGLINQTMARQLFESHQKGWGRHGQVLWNLLVLAKWSERYLTARYSRDGSYSDRSAEAAPR